uniref:MRG domain-containing protein n=1 Tax=Caenorhabditis tropicalis TaxID=1561998 RepID=A0A1I7TB10_9PELO
MSIYDRVPLDINALLDYVGDDPSKINTRQEGLKSIQTVMKMVDYVFNYRFCYVGFEVGFPHDVLREYSPIPHFSSFRPILLRFKPVYLMPNTISVSSIGEGEEKKEDETTDID